MKMRQFQNRGKSISPAEHWAELRLRETGLKFNKQTQWGYRLFDFWNDPFGVAIEIDGKEHNIVKDQSKDEFNFNRSAIIVLRVKNFDESDMDLAIKKILALDSWMSRREKMGLLTTAQKRSLIG
jgi:very-short-patch-repair endonuclease